MSCLKLFTDGETGLVDSDMAPIKITTADKLVINCRTTLPNITVDLWKDSVLVSVSQIFFSVYIINCFQEWVIILT